MDSDERQNDDAAYLLIFAEVLSFALKSASDRLTLYGRRGLVKSFSEKQGRDVVYDLVFHVLEGHLLTPLDSDPTEMFIPVIPSESSGNAHLQIAEFNERHPATRLAAVVKPEGELSIYTVEAHPFGKRIEARPFGSIKRADLYGSLVSESAPGTPPLQEGISKHIARVTARFTAPGGSKAL